MDNLAMTPLLQDRYELLEPLGEGGQGKTTRARDVQTGAEVVVKELHIERLEDWKAVELFEREAEILRRLDHPKVPAYVDAFHLDAPEQHTSRLFLVQAYVTGIDLERALRDGSLRMTEARARAFAREILQTMDYLHNLAPPVIHRDIKPSNLILQPDQTLALVDFGAVQTVLGHSVGGSTVVGTLGFIPPEQMIGRAVPASDLYALGATLIRLMSRKHPAELPMERMRLKFRSAIQASEPFAHFLDQLLAPNVEERLTNAAEALEALDLLDQPLPAPAITLATPRPMGHTERRVPRPEGTDIVLERRPGELLVRLPRRSPLGRTGGQRALAALVVMGLFVYTVVFKAGLRGPVTLALLMPASLIVTWLLGMTFKTTTLSLNAQRLRVEHQALGFSWGREVGTSNFFGLRSMTVNRGKYTEEMLVLKVEGKNYPFGASLTALEREWLVQEFGRGTQALPAD